MTPPKKHLQIQDDVRRVLRAHPHAGDHYWELTFRFWEIVDGYVKYDAPTGCYYIDEKNLDKLTSPEAVSRAFRRVLDAAMRENGVEPDEWRRREEKRYRGAYSALPGVDDGDAPPPRRGED